MRLAEAFQSFERLEKAEEWSEFESAWEALIWNLNRVYAALEQSVKGFPKSEAWFSIQKRVRSTDSALQYLHQARHSNEHSIREILKREPASVGISHPSGSMYIQEAHFGPAGIEKLIGWGPDGSPLEIRTFPERIELVSVFNRGQKYDPPEFFLGEKLENRTPLGLAGKVLEHITVLFSDAENLLVAD